MPGSAEEVHVVGEEDIASDEPVFVGLPGREEGLHRGLAGKEGFAISGANGDEKNAGLVVKFPGSVGVGAAAG